MKSNKLLLILLVGLVLSSCATEIFRLNRQNIKESIPGYFLTGFASVEIINDNSLLLKKDAAISLKNIESTEWLAIFDLMAEESMSLDLQFRTTRQELSKDSGVLIKIRNSSIEFYENGVEIAQSIDYKFTKNEKYSVKILNDGVMVKVFIDCDEILDHRTKLLSTEYLIFRSVSKEFVISSLEFQDVYEGEEANNFDFILGDE